MSQMKQPRPRTSRLASPAACRVLGAALLMLAACGPLRAHELLENRATLVQREATFVSMTLYIDLPEALHRAIAPKRSFEAFAVAHANLPLDAFNAVLMPTISRMQSETHVTTGKDQVIAVGRWAWPEPARVQASLRERLMAAVVAPGDHAHAAPLEVRAELRSGKPITSLRVRFAAALGRVMVVSYRPQQVWVEPRSPSPNITF